MPVSCMGCPFFCLGLVGGHFSLRVGSRMLLAKVLCESSKLFGVYRTGDLLWRWTGRREFFFVLGSCRIHSI